MWLYQGKEIQLPDDGLGTETCRSNFSVLMCKFYIIALVGIIIEWLDNMHGVTMKISSYYFTFGQLFFTFEFYFRI